MVGAIVAVFAASLLVRFIVPSQYGVPGAWIYFGLPIEGIGVVLLLRLGLLNFSEKPWPNRRLTISAVAVGRRLR